MACTHNMSVATWFTPVPCIGFIVLSSNGWADLLAFPAKHSGFGLEQVRIQYHYFSRAELNIIKWFWSFKTAFAIQLGGGKLCLLLF